VVHDVAVGVLSDVGVAEPGFVVADFAVGVFELDFAVFGGFDFGAAEDEPASMRSDRE